MARKRSSSNCSGFTVAVILIALSIFCGISFIVSLMLFHDTDPQGYEQEMAQLLGVRGETIVIEEKTWRVETPQGRFREVKSVIQPFYIEYWNGNQALFYAPADIWQAVITASNKHPWCDPILTLAVAHSESPVYRNYDTENPKSAMGVWQFIRSTWAMMWPDEKTRPPRTDITASADAACRYLQMTGAMDAIRVNEGRFVQAFAVIPLVWNQDIPHAKYVWRLHKKIGLNYTPIENVAHTHTAPAWAVAFHSILEELGIGIKSFAFEPSNPGEGTPSPPIGGSLCRPVPEEAVISYPFGIRYKWGTHWGTDFIIRKDGVLQNVPAYALAEGTITTGWHHSVDGIVTLRPKGFSQVVIQYYHMNENSIRNLPHQVSCGDPLGFADGGGTVSDGKHLHLEIWVKGKKVDPMKWIAENGGSP